MTNVMRGWTAVLIMAVCAPAGAQTVPDRSKIRFEFGVRGGDSTPPTFNVAAVTQPKPFRLAYRKGDGNATNEQQGAWSIGRFGFSDQEDTIAVRTFALRYLDSEDAAKLVGPYVRSPGSAVYDAGARASAITVREQPGILATIDSVLREFDRAPSSVVLNFQLLTSTGTPTTDPAIRDIDGALRGLFRFPGYRVIAEGTTIASDFSDFTMTMSGESDRFIVSGTMGRVKLGSAPNVKLDVDLKAAPRNPAPVDSVPRTGMIFDMMMGSQVVASGITMPLGEAVVLGSGSITEQKGTLILVVRSTLRPPLPR